MILHHCGTSLTHSIYSNKWSVGANKQASDTLHAQLVHQLLTALSAKSGL